MPSAPPTREPPGRYQLDGKGPVFRQIERSITEMILNGRLRPGDKLPPEIELSDLFETSRQTVNKAITELAKHGLVARRRRAGTLVCAQFQERFVLPIRDISELVAERGKDYSFEVTRRIRIENGRAGHRWSDLPEGSPLLYLECLHRAGGQPIQFERRYVSIEIIPAVEQEPFDDFSPGRWLQLRIPWSTVRHRIKAINAAEDIARPLGIPPGTACLEIERATVHLGSPITLVHFTHPGDRFELDGLFSVGGDLDRSGLG